MEFSSLTFLFLFLPIFLLILFILKTLPLSTRLKNSAHNLFLLTGSLVFYAWGAGAFVFLLLISIIGNYLLGLLIDKTDGKSIKKFVFLLALIFNTGLMVYYKYMNFILDNLNLTGVIDPVLLPIGISFFTFQAISYLVDIYRKTVPNDRNPINFALYMSFFPKLLT
ncbi:MAG: MBOAT family protein, partial [Gammaproteobacteria bacterium]|nr:MBOAT family protein [Gammaproteobacteria bacterium]